MKPPVTLLLLAVTWAAGFLPIASVGFEDRSLEVSLLDTAPAISALLFVTTALVGLSLYLRRSILASGLAALGAVTQVLPTLAISSASPVLLAKYAELSGIDLSAAQLVPTTIEIFPALWMFPLLSILLAISLLLLTRSKAVLRGARDHSSRRIPAPRRPSTPGSQSDLWSSQLLDSRAKNRKTDAG